MEQTLQLVQVHNENRIDSRLVADRLGIEHKHFLETVRTYQAKLELLGQLPFQTGVVKGHNGGGNPTKYALLNEDQAIFAATLSRNTERVVDFKLQLTQAFAEARKQVQLSQVNTLWQQRLTYFHHHTHILDGYWCVFGFAASHCWTEEFKGVQLLEDALPDGSIGKRWCTYLREHGYDMSLIKKYPHHYPDKRGTVLANIYPNAWLSAFWSWFHEQYLKQYYPTYLQTHRAQPRHLKEGGK